MVLVWTLCGGQVIKAYQKWRHAVTKLDRTRFRYQKAKAANALRRKPRPEESLIPRHRTGFLGLLGPKVESIPHWIHEVKERSEALRHEQLAAASRRRTGTAFVIFNSRRATSLAAQTAHAVHGMPLPAAGARPCSASACHCILLSLPLYPTAIWRPA